MPQLSSEASDFTWLAQPTIEQARSVGATRGRTESPLALLLENAAFAAAWVASRQTGRGLSKRALASELRVKGVDPEVAAVALEAVDPQDEWDTARRLVEKKIPSMRRLDTVTATRRLTGMLARKGYNGGLAGIVVREALGADADTDPDDDQWVGPT